MAKLIDRRTPGCRRHCGSVIVATMQANKVVTVTGNGDHDPVGGGQAAKHG